MKVLTDLDEAALRAREYAKNEQREADRKERRENNEHDSYGGREEQEYVQMFDVILLAKFRQFVVLIMDKIKRLF